MTLPPGRAKLVTMPLPTGSNAAQDDWDFRCRLFCGEDGGSRCDNDVNLEPARTRSRSRCNVRRVPPPSGIRWQHSAPRSSRGRAIAEQKRRQTGYTRQAWLCQKSDGRQFSWLCAGCKRPQRGSTTTNHFEEITPLHRRSPSLRAEHPRTGYDDQAKGLCGWMAEQRPLWVISGHDGEPERCLLYPQKRTFARHV